MRSKKEKRNRKTSFSLWFLGATFLVFRPERKLCLLSGSSFCIYVVHTSRFQAAFESRPANTGGKKWATQRNSVVLQILVSFSNLLTTIYFSMVHTFRPGIINAFRGDRADCIYSIFPRTNLSSIRLPFQLRLSFLEILCGSFSESFDQFWYPLIFLSYVQSFL